MKINTKSIISILILGIVCIGLFNKVSYGQHWSSNPLDSLTGTISKDIPTSITNPLERLTHQVIPFIRTGSGRDWLDFSSGNIAIMPGDFVRAQDGHFVNSGNPNLRLFGVNTTFENNAPPKAVADAHARRLKRLGFNVVRFHHMDFNKDGGNSLVHADGMTIDTDYLDRLDYFIYKLKENGIYSNLNLHVSRTYPAIKNITRTSEFNYGKILDLFSDTLIQDQKDYATTFLGHTNPYTGLRYADDPAVIAIELNNENTLLTNDFGWVVNLPSLYRDELQNKWNTYLLNKYSNDVTWRAALEAVATPFGNELLDKPWEVQSPGLQTLTGSDTASGKVYTMVATDTGPVSYSLQMIQKNRNFELGKNYTFSMEVKSNVPGNITIASNHADNYSNCGLYNGYTTEENTDWKLIQFIWTPENPDIPNCGQWINFNNIPGTYEFRNISQKESGIESIPTGKNWSIENKTAELIGTPGNPVAFRDWIDFLMELEGNYILTMRDHLENTIGTKQMIANSQADFGKGFGSIREGLYSDYVDDHAYWQHPRFPGIAWDQNNWNILNTSMILSPLTSTIKQLSVHRVNGKPFSVSEYSHSAPGEFTGEGIPMITAAASFQDWDAIYLFDYGTHEEKFGKISAFFDISGDTMKLTFAGLSSYVFRNKLLEPGNTLTLIPGKYTEMVERIFLKGANDYASQNSIVTNPLTLITNRVAMDVSLGGLGNIAKNLIIPPTIITDNNQIIWTNTGKISYQVKTPKFKMITGDLSNETYHLGNGVSIGFENTIKGTVTAMLVPMDLQEISTSNHMILGVGGIISQSGMIWNNTNTSISSNWGSGSLFETIDGHIELTGRYQAFALDTNGQPTYELPIVYATGTNQSQFEIRSGYRTLTYLFIREAPVIDISIPANPTQDTTIKNGPGGGGGGGSSNSNSSNSSSSNSNFSSIGNIPVLYSAPLSGLPLSGLPFSGSLQSSMIENLQSTQSRSLIPVLSIQSFVLLGTEDITRVHTEYRESIDALVTGIERDNMKPMEIGAQQRIYGTFIQIWRDIAQSSNPIGYRDAAIVLCRGMKQVSTSNKEINILNTFLRNIGTYVKVK